MTPISSAPPRKKVSGAGYWIGAVLIVLGIGAGMALIVSGAYGLLDEIQTSPHVDVGSSGSVTLTQVGCNDLYLVSPTQGSLSFTDPKVTITGSDGSLITSSAPCPSAGGNSTAGSQQLFRAFGSVSVPTAGSYTMKVERPSGVAAAGLYVAVARPFDLLAESVGMKVLVGIGVGFLGVVVGTVAIVITAVRRGRAKKSTGGYPPGGYPPGGYAPGGYPPGGYAPGGYAPGQAAGGWGPPGNSDPPAASAPPANAGPAPGTRPGAGDGGDVPPPAPPG